MASISIEFNIGGFGIYDLNRPVILNFQSGT